MGKYIFIRLVTLQKLLGTVRQWHWISSAVCLVGIILFAVTGITLNHAADIKVTPKIVSVETDLSATMLKTLKSKAAEGKGALPLAVRSWLKQQHAIETTNAQAEWSEDEVYLGMPKPGGDAWLSIDLNSGELLYENTSRGVISYLNDLHKGRNTGVLWSWFIDVFSVLCLIFSISGLWLLFKYAKQRPSTWPLVGLGLVIPLLIIILTVH